MKSRLFSLCALGTCAVGCGLARQPDLRLPEVVEYTQQTQHGETRVLLRSNGVGEVDFAGAGVREREVHSVVLPVSPGETMRLARAASALLGSSVATPINSWEEVLHHRKGMVLRCYRDGKKQEARIGPGQDITNLLWRGLVDEINAVALADLARALHFRRTAELFAARRDYDVGIRKYKEAIQAFVRWAGARSQRYWDGVYEPGLVIVEIGDREIATTRLPSDLVKATNGSDETCLALLRWTWQDLTEGEVTTTSRNGVTVVALTGELGRLRTTGSPSAVPEDALRSLDRDRAVAGN